jgi:hypothetical protein
VHGIEEGELEEYLLESDEECEGAVHVDGFLREVKGMRRSGLGRGARKRKEKTKDKEKEVESSSSSSSEGE